MRIHRTKPQALMVLPVLASLFCVSGAMAQTDATAGTLVLRAVAELEVTLENPDGTRVVRRVPAETVVPGDEVIYTLVYDNRSAAPADEVFITNPIPEHMEFQSAAASPAGLETIYSVDGGRVFGPLSELTVADGAGRNRQALPRDCTHIRWQFHRPLAPGETGQVSYTTRLL